MSDDKTRILSAGEAARIASAPAESDDRTRVLSAEDAARIATQAQAQADSGAARSRSEPKLVGDKVVFFCSKGHRIVVDKSLAGKRGNCSKPGCGVPVVIPVPAGLVVPHDEEPRPPAGSKRSEPAAEEPVPPAATAEPTVAFDFTAKPEARREPPAVSPPPPPAPPVAAPAVVSWEFSGADAPDPLADPVGLGVEAVGEGGGWSLDGGGIDHPTARLVARLWQERAHGGVVEVHLTGGGVIMPEFYDPRWSCGDHALFAALAPDGTVTLTAVAWDQVQRVVVRQVQGKPDGMFGE